METTEKKKPAPARRKRATASKKRKKAGPGRGGKREGAGRKPGATGPYKENPKTKMLPFRVSEKTAERIKTLRELTKQDTKPFVDMLEDWVEQLSKDYGLEE